MAAPSPGAIRVFDEAASITAQAWRNLGALPRTPERAQAEKLLHQIDWILPSRTAGWLPEMELRDLGDHLSLQWLSRNCRLGFNFENDIEKSGWFITARGEAVPNAFGTLRTVDLESLIDTFIEQQRQ